MNQHFLDMLSLFNAEGVDYLLVGGQAMAVHGVGRATGDMDLWVDRNPENAAKIWRALERFGAPLNQITPADFQTDDLIFQIGVVPNRIDIITRIDGVEFADAWVSRVTAKIFGMKVPVIGREKFIQNKKSADRPQDRADVTRLEERSE